MRRWCLPLLVAVGVLSGGTGCMMRVADMTALSTRNVYLDKCDLDALDKGGGDLMLDASVYTGGWWFFVGQSKIRVKGSVVKTRRGEK